MDLARIRLCSVGYSKTIVIVNRSNSFCCLLFHSDGILPEGPYLPCLRMADRALLAGYPRLVLVGISLLGSNHWRSGRDMELWVRGVFSVKIRIQCRLFDAIIYFQYICLCEFSK